MQKVLVTGASGFVGGHVVHALHARGFSVRCLVRKTSRLEFLEIAAPELLIGDVTEPEKLEAALDGVDAVVHCAGLTKAPSLQEYLRVNEAGCRNLYDACLKRRHEIARIVHISSLAAIGPAIDGQPVTEESAPHPISYYGKSKLAGQRVAESCRDELPIAILLPPAVYGPRDTDFLVYFKFVRRGIMPRIGNSLRRFSLIYVKDLARAVVELLANERAAGHTYFVNDGCIHTWMSVADTIARVMDKAPKRILVPIMVLRCAGAIGDFLSKIKGETSLINSQKVLEFLQEGWTCSAERIHDELGFHASCTLAQGMRETLAWYQENKWL
jgi:nucleoside-diphosphate-sugar epimerase